MGFAKFIIFLLAVFIIILLLAFLLPSRVTVAKSVEINAPRQNIMNQIVNFEEWKNWYPAFKDENISVIKNEASADYITSVTLKNKNGTAIVLNLIDTSNNQIDVQVQSASSTKVIYQNEPKKAVIFEIIFAGTLLRRVQLLVLWSTFFRNSFIQVDSFTFNFNGSFILTFFIYSPFRFYVPIFPIKLFAMKTPNAWHSCY